MNTIDTIINRHSYRGGYKQEKMPRKDLMKIVEAGLSAPSGCNKQTTSLIVVDDQDVLKKLHSVIKPPIGETAPAMICVLTRRIYAYRDKCFSVQDYSAAIENMLLAIVELGYQSCWMAKILNVPDEYDLVAFLPVGIALEDMKPVKKIPFHQRAWFNSFGTNLKE